MKERFRLAAIIAACVLLCCAILPHRSSADDDPDIVPMAKLRAQAWQFWLDMASLRPSIPDSPQWKRERDAFAPPQPLGVVSVKSNRGAATTTAVGLILSYPVELLEHGPVAPPSSNDEFHLFESTFYNSAAVDHIVKTDLYKPSTTDALLGQSRREITEFPRDARIVKTFWRPIPDGGSAKVGVWKWKNLPDVDERIPESRFKELSNVVPVCVADKRSPQPGCLIAQDEFVTATVGDTSLFNCPFCTEELRQGQTMILIGMHIISKERPDWFWTTFWWQGVDRQDGTIVTRAGAPKEPSWTCDNAQRPAALSPRALGDRKYWSNYSLDLVASFNRKRPEVAAEDVSACGQPRIIGNNEERFAGYNPFVEGVRSSGRKSSCLDCHARASTIGDKFAPIPPKGDTVGPKIKDFEGYIRTDYLFRVAKHLNPTN
jgi:hypothetical protein